MMNFKPLAVIAALAILPIQSSLAWDDQYRGGYRGDNRSYYHGYRGGNRYYNRGYHGNNWVGPAIVGGVIGTIIGGAIVNSNPPPPAYYQAPVQPYPTENCQYVVAYGRTYWNCE